MKGNTLGVSSTLVARVGGVGGEIGVGGGLRSLRDVLRLLDVALSERPTPPLFRVSLVSTLEVMVRIKHGSVEQPVVVSSGYAAHLNILETSSRAWFSL